MKVPYSLIVLSFLLFASLYSYSYAASRSPPLVGGYSPIKNLDDPEVKEIASFAVTEYNKRTGAKLTLVKIIRGWTQVVAGINYRLDLATKEGHKTKNYEAVVWDKSWEHFRNLTSFKPLH